MKLTDINENSIPTPDEAGNRVKDLLAKHKGKPGLPAVPGNDHARNAYHADQDRAEQQQRDDRATANEEQINELDMGTEKTWAAKASKWRSEQPMDFKDPVATAKAERRAEREMNIRNKHGVKAAPTTKEVDEGRFVKGPGGVPLDRNGQPKVATQRVSYAHKPAAQRDNSAPYNTDDPAIADFVAKGGNVKMGAYNGPRKSEEPGFGSRHIGGVRDAMSGKSGRTLGHGANTNFKGLAGKPVVASEGSMGGINRSAPSNDVSYEKTLNGTKDTWRGQTVKVNELKDDSETLKNYKDKVRNTVPTNMRQASNRIQGLRRVQDREDNARIDKDARAKGDPRLQESVEATYAAKLGKFVAEVLNEVSKDTLKSYVKKSSRDMSDRASGEGYKAAKKNADKPYNTADETPKEKKRQSGIDKATDKLADTEYGKKLKEFVEKIMK